MKGLKLFNKGDNIEKSVNYTGNYDLVARDNGLEVLVITVKPSSLIICQPFECKAALNIYFIIEGIVEHQGGKNLLKSGDFFTVKDIEEPAVFKALEETKLIWVIKKNIFNDVALENKAITDLLKAIQCKDQYTQEHCQRVGKLVRALASKFNLSDIKISNIILAAMCHDVGKIHTPIEILNKPGRLNEEEFDIIKKHASDGAEIVRRGLNDDVARIVVQHHERLNGQGYPKNLKADEIITEAKILAVIDSFDAMISDRPYRKGMSVEQALVELKNCVGEQYEMEIVKKFEEVLYEEGYLR